MKTKLTLSVNRELLVRARKISKARQTTLSEIFEKTILLMENDKAASINPKVKSLQGILKTTGKKALKEDYYENRVK